MFLTELAEPQLLVIYPGRFQPFHKGHAAVYQGLVGKYGRNNVFIATSGKTGDDKHPFTFSEKLYFMQLQGVPADRVVEATQPYQIETVLAGGRIQVADRTNTIVCFAVSEKDMAEDPRFSSWSKKDGSPTYFQPYPNDISGMEDMTKHAYILTVPTKQFTVLGQVIDSASTIRQMYAEADAKTRQQIVIDVFGKYTAEAEQILNNKLLEAVAPKVPKLASSTKLQPVGKVKEISEGEDSERYKLISKARIAHPLAKSDEEALALYLNDKEQHDFDNVEHEEHNLESEVAELYNKFMELRFDVDELQKLKESRIIDPDKIDVWYRPDRNTNNKQARVIATSVPSYTLDTLISALVKKYGVAPTDFQWSPSKDSVNKINEAEGTPEGLPHLTKEVLKHIVQQVGTEGAHAIVKSLEWGDGAAEELLQLIKQDLKQNIGMAESVKQRLDKSCWKGYHKAGTKIKGGVRVNNCVPNESIAEAGGVGVVKGGNDPRYSMATAGDQNDVNGETLGKEMKAFGLTGRANPGAVNHQKNVNKNVGKGVNESIERLTQILRGM